MQDELLAERNEVRGLEEYAMVLVWKSGGGGWDWKGHEEVANGVKRPLLWGGGRIEVA